MKRRFIRSARVGLVGFGTLLLFASCGHDRKLVSIQVAPTQFTFGAPIPGQSAQFRAYGTFIHPPVTRDITDQVTWAVDDDIVSIAAGLVTTTGLACGTTNVTATMPEGTGGASNIIIGAGSVVVTCP